MAAPPQTSARARQNKRAKTAAGAGVAPKRTRGRPSNHAAKREDIITGATSLFNERGIAGVSLTDVANLADIARASIYHYVKDRNELVFQCYSRACQLAADDLNHASKAKTGFARTIEYMRRSLTPDRAPVAVLTEVNSLDPEIANVIRCANTANTNQLISFISQGIKDGSMRDCDEDVAAQAINGMLAWLQLLPEWSEGYNDAQGRARVAESLVELLTHGLATNRKKPFQCTLRAQQFGPQIDDIFDRQQSSALKVERVLAAASRLFTRNGIEATSIDEIAGELGVTKGVLYHYLKDKTDLITQCYQRSFDLYDRFVDAAKASGGDGLAAALINAHLNTQAQAGTLSPLLPQPGFGALAGPIRRKLHKRAADQNHALANLLKQGMQEGAVRPCATGLVTHMCAGAIGWIPKWLPSDSLYTPAEMGDKICDLFRLGLRA